MLTEMITIKKEDVEMFTCPEIIKLFEMYEYFIFDQEHELTCSVSAAVSLVEYLRQKDGKECEKFSVVFLYGKAVAAEPHPDNVIKYGLKASSVINALLKNGVCLENSWPSDKHFYVEPSTKVVLEALNRLKHCDLEKIDADIHCIRYILGYCERPIVAVLNIYDMATFCNLETSYEPIQAPPINKTLEVINRHSVLLVGYDDQDRILYFQNSYGTQWGKNGFGRISYDYIPFFGILYSMDESCIKGEF